MIFLSVGTQEPFDRLVRAVDSWAATASMPVFGQLGRLTASSFRPSHMDWAEFLPADLYAEKLAACRLMVTHAGMGSIISALTHMKPLLMLPRRASLGEHRNEHQLATAEKFAARPGLYIASNESEIPVLIDRLLATPQLQGASLEAEASPELIAAVRQFILG
ncbi:glycosyltransferase [Thermaurantiacus sp.]